LLIRDAKFCFGRKLAYLAVRLRPRVSHTPSFNGKIKDMKNSNRLLVIVVLFTCMIKLHAQVSLTTLNVPVVITFDATRTGVNNGSYTAAAAGVSNAPAAGQLNTNAWAFTGLSDGNVAFGGSSALGDFARGASNGGVTTGGLYGFDISNTAANNRALGVQQTATDMTVGYIYLRLINNTGTTITQLNLSYDLYYYNDQDNSETINFGYSPNNVNYKTDYTMDYRTPEAAGAATWLSVNKSLSITSINIPNGAFYYFRWTVNDLSTAFSRDEFALDNISVTPQSGGCITGTQPTIPASNFQLLYQTCNGMRLTWTSGNGAKRVVVAKQGSAPSTLPADLSTYVAVPNFGATSQTASGEFVVYNGSGQNVLITGLLPSTTYFFTIVEYNGTPCGENYLTSSVTTNSATTTAACAPCPQLITCYVNACNGICGEGTNELLLFTTGGWFFPVHRDEDFVPTDMVMFGNVFPPNIDYTAGFTSMPATIAAMNASVGACSPAVFYDGLSIEVMPPNTNFMLLPETFCTPTSYAFAGLCGAGPIYVYFTNDMSWNATGNFTHANSPVVTRYFRTDFTFLTGAPCVVDYTYSTGSLSGLDGDYIVWNGGGAPILYANSGCTVPATALPVEWLSFTAYRDEYVRQTDIEWATATESNNQYFDVERTIDGINWTVITRVNGAGTSSQPHNYSAVDPNPENGINYYRIKQVDFNGQFSYSTIVPVQFENSAVVYTVFPSPSDGQFTLNGPMKKGDQIEIFSLSGQLIRREIITAEASQFDLNLNDLAAGTYMLRIGNQLKTEQCLRIVISH
jgi:Secretion system C-terminal sorting domain